MFVTLADRKSTDITERQKESNVQKTVQLGLNWMFRHQIVTLTCGFSARLQRPHLADQYNNLKCCSSSKHIEQFKSSVAQKCAAPFSTYKHLLLLSHLAVPFCSQITDEIWEIW